MTEQTLFADCALSVEQRVQNINAQIFWLLSGNRGGPLGLTLSDDEKRVLSFIRYRRGATNAITISDMRSLMLQRDKRALTEREIKRIVRTLRLDFHLPIGSNKGGIGGYFVMVSDQDYAILSAQILDQVRAEIEVLKAVSRRLR